MREDRGFASDATLAALEFPAFLKVVAARAATDAGREALLALRPATDRPSLDRALGGAREVEQLLARGTLVETFEEPILPILDRLERDPANIAGSELGPIRLLLRALAGIAERVRSVDPPCPELGARLSELPDLSDLVRGIEKTLDERGGVREEASPKLAAAAKRARRLRQSLYRRLEGLARRHSEHMAEETIPLHDGRLLLLLRSGSKGRMAGLVHGRSATAKSFYFEPLEAVEPNNELQEALSEQDEEKRRIFKALMDEIYSARRDLLAHLEALAEIDLRQAAARWGQRIDSRLMPVGEGQALRLLEARHPLLEPRLADDRLSALGQKGHTEPIVPLSLELGGEGRVMVVTGPNAGGKTVALKTLGLLVAAAHCALPVSAASGSRIPRFERLIATVGDEQDLLADRSTFSGRLVRLQEAWEEASASSLVLLDELGSGTDPEEGAALSIALLERLVESGALAVVTSHLTPLAAAALERPGATCAAMEFDSKTGKPTFELLPGAPGSSEAVALGRRLGLAEEWLRRAEELLGPGHRRLQGLLREAESLRESLTARLTELRDAREALESDRRAATNEREQAESERRDLAKKTRSELRRFKSEVSDRLNRELRAMREELEAGRRKGLVGEAVERLFEKSPAPAETAHEPETGGTIEVGRWVRHLGLGWEGEVRKVDGKRVEVIVRGKRVRCRFEELEPLEDKALAPAASIGGSGTDTATEATPELHLLGRRVEEALEEIDVYLDRALLSSSPDVRIVHGHGTGRLKKAVRRHLDRHPAVASWRPGGDREGGDGATVVTLAE